MQPHFKSGSVLDGRYEVGEVIGGGGETIVHKARDTEAGRTVAVREYLKNDSESRHRWKRECSLNVRSDHVVRHFDGGECSGRLYVVVEYVQGESLEEHLVASGEYLPVDEGLRIARQIARGVADLHGAGKVHRDLKTDNMMVDGSGQVKIIDFGLVRDRAARRTIADDGAARGTLHYMSPEHLVNPAGVGRRSDLYGVGVIFYRMVTGTLPFDGPDARTVQHKILKEDPLPPTALRPELSGEHEDIILTLLSKNPKARIKTASALLARLDGRQPGACCPACGRPGTNGAAYCAACGVDLAAAEEAPAMLRVEAAKSTRWIAVPADGLEVGRQNLDPSNRAVSSRHARLFRAGGEWHLEDLGSTNGVWVEGRRVSGRQALSDGAFLQLADVTCFFTTNFS